jgi:hypothetical protein
VTRIDRLARSTFDLFAIVKGIVDAGGQFRSLAEPWADTSTSTGRLMLAVLGGLADVERPDPHPHGGRPQPGEGARAAHGPSLETHRRAEGGGPDAAAPKVRRSRNWPGATMSALRRFPGSRRNDEETPPP